MEEPRVHRRRGQRRVPRRRSLRYRILYAAARLTRSGRRRTLKIAATWPWADDIITAWQLIQAIPHPT